MPRIPDYELVRIVGRGSYGDVWLARSVTGAWRAIKVVWRERFTNAEPFEREFRGLKEFADISLRESSQMTLLHVGRNDAAGFFYYVMELADDAEHGPLIEPANYVPLTLAEMRARRGRIAADKCARFGVELARVLASLHRRGLVHRDVKPSNVIFVAGLPKLADIGLVAPSGNAHTFVGTEGYVPPEGPGAPSADVFALGKVLYELSTGHDRQEFPKLPADLASFPDRVALLELNEIILRACGPSPAQRYRDGAAILADLTAVNAGVSLRTRRLTAFMLRVAAVSALVAALGGGIWLWKTRPGPPPAPIAAGVSARSVAVLPLVNRAGDSAADLLCDGISDEILHALERERDLRVTGSRASFWTKDQKLSRVEMAKRLRVAYLVEGSGQWVGARLRLQMRLTRGVDGASEELGTFVGDANDLAALFALQDEVARAIAQRILHRVTMPALVPSTKNLEAYHEFLCGRALQARGVAKPADVAEYFTRAVELDPDFAVAWARLAEVRHRIEGIHGRARDASPNDSGSTVKRALALQPNLALAWTVSGFIHGVGRGDIARGLSDLARAEELGGPNADTRMARFLVQWNGGEARGLLPLAREAIASNPENLERIAVIRGALDFLGDFAELDRLYRQAIESSGPEQSVVSFAERVRLRQRWRGAEAALRLAEQAPENQAGRTEMRVQMLAALGRGEKAAKLLEGVDPSGKRETWRAFVAAGMVDRAREFIEAPLSEAYQKLNDPTLSTRHASVRDGAHVEVIEREMALGLHASARAHLDAWQRDVGERTQASYRSAGLVQMMPRFYAQLGKHDVAIALLKRRVADGGMSLGYELRDSPAYASMRDDPDFLALRRQADAWAAMQPEPPDEPDAPLRN